MTLLRRITRWSTLRLTLKLHPEWTTCDLSPRRSRRREALDRVRQAIRTRHLSRNTEQAYVSWIKRFIFFHHKRHPAEMGEPEIGQFLSSLATDARVSASTQTKH